jgi:single-strand selective monofunctional uracil DNA glycosylase
VRLQIPQGSSPAAAALLRAAWRLASEVEGLDFGSPVAAVYNPLRYAWSAHAAYLVRYGSTLKRVVFLGMNPGPWGMAQTGVPFGEVEAVRGWMGISAEVGRPPREHPRRPVEGFATHRSEVSGRRLWGLMRKRFGSAAAFFREQFVANYCPLLFLEAGGRNLTPDRLPAGQRVPLFAACDRHLRALLEVLKPQWAVGVGRFTEGRLRSVLSVAAGGRTPHVQVAAIPHPSPANPRANRDWEERTVEVLVSLDIWS